MKRKLTFNFYPSSGSKTPRVNPKNKYHKYDTTIIKFGVKTCDNLRRICYLSRKLVQICNFCTITGNGATKIASTFQKVNIFFLQVWSKSLTLFKYLNLVTPLIEELTHFKPVLLSYRNRSIDLLCELIDWFFHNRSAGLKWVK